MITNPTQKQLDEWYKCDKKNIEYFVRRLAPIHVDEDGFYYFVKNSAWKKVIKNAPFGVRIREMAKI